MGELLVPKHRQITLRHEGPSEGLMAGSKAADRVVFSVGSVYKPLSENLVVGTRGIRVIVYDNTPDSNHDIVLDMPWEAAMGLSREMKNLALKINDGVVQVIEGDTLLIEVPWTSAFQLAKAIRNRAAQAEQNSKVLKVIEDQALLIRKGFPISFTRNPEVFKEAGNEAAWNTDLRRFLPGGVPSGVQFGYPGVFGLPLRKKVATIGAKSIESAETFGRIGGR